MLWNYCDTQKTFKVFKWKAKTKPRINKWVTTFLTKGKQTKQQQKTAKFEFVLLYY